MELLHEACLCNFSTLIIPVEKQGSSWIRKVVAACRWCHSQHLLSASTLSRMSENTSSQRWSWDTTALANDGKWPPASALPIFDSCSESIVVHGENLDGVDTDTWMMICRGLCSDKCQCAMYLLSLTKSCQNRCAGMYVEGNWSVFSLLMILVVPSQLYLLSCQ